MENKTPIFLDNEEIEVFKWLWKKYKVFEKAKRILRPGKLILHCNTRGDFKPEFDIVGDDAVDNL